MQFEEPESTGGVPILRYKAEWRMHGRGHWTHKVFEVEDGTTTRKRKLKLLGNKKSVFLTYLNSLKVEITVINTHFNTFVIWGYTRDKKLIKSFDIENNPNP